MHPLKIAGFSFISHLNTNPNNFAPLKDVPKLGGRQQKRFLADKAQAADGEGWRQQDLGPKPQTWSDRPDVWLKIEELGLRTGLIEELVSLTTSVIQVGVCRKKIVFGKPFLLYHRSVIPSPGYANLSLWFHLPNYGHPFFEQPCE